MWQVGTIIFRENILTLSVRWKRKSLTPRIEEICLFFRSLNDFTPNYRASMVQHRNVDLKYILFLRTKRFIYTLPCYLLENISQYFLQLVYFVFFNILIAVESCSDRKTSENISIRASFMLQNKLFAFCLILSKLVRSSWRTCAIIKSSQRNAAMSPSSCFI